MTRNNKILLAVVTVVAIVLALLVATNDKADATGGQDKVGICHRTGSESNPYVFLSVPEKQANGHITGDDKQHNEKVTWATAGVWDGRPHAAGDLRLDYYASEGTTGKCASGTSEPPTDEPTIVTALAPTFVDECGPDNEVLTVPTVTGVYYDVSEDAGVITVTAFPLDDTYVLAEGQIEWTFTINDVACPTETPTVPTETPTVTPPVVTPEVPVVTPEVPVETDNPGECGEEGGTSESCEDETPDEETPETETPVQTPQPPVKNPPKNVQLVACVDGVFVTTVNGEVISESGSCDETSVNSVPQTFSETGL